MARHSSHKWGLVIWLTKFAEAWCLKVVVEKLIDETKSIRLSCITGHTAVAMNWNWAL